ncbi:FtsX-like permease family protein [Marinoscillum pacificum]|uniref:FtsX-like permease family protein n=1 Tax=Marinoscillum pacificum TaxID=392723 RepID=UPI002157CD95|nr:FtsX-like permease family protein [Marinoscillum pacificum]
MSTQPPKLATWLFEKLCGAAFAEDLRGDLDEIYGKNIQNKGQLKANLIYWQHTLSLGFSYALKKRKQDVTLTSYSTSRELSMLRNYIKISIRNLKKQKTFTVLNIIGLAMGMSIMVLCLAVYVDLLKFDEHHVDADRIYRVITTVEHDGNKETFASSPTALGKLAKDQLPNLEVVIPINDQFYANAQTNKGDLKFQGYITTSEFLSVFDFPLAYGSKTSLQTPNSVIITHEFAEKLFGTDNALNQIITTEKWGPLKVSGVLAPFPKHTHFEFDVLAGTSTINPSKNRSLADQWTDFHGNYFYFKIAEGSTKSQIASSIAQLAKEGNEYFIEQNEKATFKLQAIVDINPNEDISDDLGVVFEHSGFLLFFGIALLILLPACFNYTNMSIARALHRSKEIGIRKVIGSQRKQIIEQFLVETIIVCLISTVLSVGIFELIKREFVSTLADGSALSMDLTWQMSIAFIIFGVLVGALTGIVPALYFAKISPLSALKNNMTEGQVSISGLRKGLLTAQFSLTLIFMIGIGSLFQQYRLSLTHDLGFNKENILVIPISNQKQDILKNTLLANPDVRNVSFTNSIPGTDISNKEYVYFKSIQDSMRFYSIQTSESFIEHMDIKMVWGNTPDPRNKQIPDVVVNEAFMKDIRVINPDSDSLLIQLITGPARISGVVQNYHHEPLNSRIYPMVISLSENCHLALVSITSSDLAQTLESLETSWNEVYPNEQFTASFLTDEIEKAYEFFRVVLKIFGYLAFLAISVSCLGLLGMVIYSTENRTKEVAIRKILGANHSQLLKTLAGMFFKLWAIAIVIAVPVAYTFYDLVLIRLFNKFSDGIGSLEILVSVVITVGLGTLAILWQTNKIVQINPANNLRTE